MNPPRRTLAGCLDDYLTLRRALGCKLTRAERDLRQFLDYLGQRGQDTLTAEAAADWVRRSRHGTAAPGLGMEAIRGFAVFLHAHDPAHAIPPPGLFPRRRVRAVPYLYSPADIAALQAAAGELPRVFRTGNSGLIYAAIFIPVSSSMTSRGVLYPSVE